MKSIAIFNNKGGVGKTTYLFHIANLMADKGKKVLMVDCDSQCNLTAYSMTEETIEQSWSYNGNSIYKLIEPISKGIGDFRTREPYMLRSNLYIIPGDVDLSIFEDRLGETWGSASTQEHSIRTQVGIYRATNYWANKLNTDFIFYDLGPNLGAINRAVLLGCDYFITPLSPDLFSIKGTQNLGNKFLSWNREWSYIYRNWEVQPVVEIPLGKPKFAGYVTQQHNLRTNKEGMTLGWQIFGKRIDEAVNSNIVHKLDSIGLVFHVDNYNLGAIPNLNSLIPYSLNAHKPIYKCASAERLKGAHISRARESRVYYENMSNYLLNLPESDFSINVCPSV